MIVTYIQLIGSVAGMSAIIAYAWWLNQRIWKLRSDLFVIRDVVWMEMFEHGTLEEPEYLRFRDGVNAMIRVAPMLSILTFVRLVLDIDEVEHAVTLPKFDPESATHPLVLKAREAVFIRVGNYLFMETISGRLFFLVTSWLLMTNKLRAPITRRVEWLFDLRVLDDYNEDLSPITRPAGSREMVSV